MTKYFFRLILLIAAVLAIIAAFGSLLPRGYDFSTQIQIDAPRDVVFAEINSLPNWRTWSQWNPEKIPGLTVEYAGPDSGVGCEQSWTDIRGSGKLWITESDANRLIKYEMTFANFPKMTSEIEIGTAGDLTSVLWSSQGKLPGGPFYGFFAPFFGTQMRNQYQDSLQQLKKKLESKNPPISVGLVPDGIDN